MGASARPTTPPRPGAVEGSDPGLITESPEGGWGIDGHANTNADIAAAARAAADAD